MRLVVLGCSGSIPGPDSPASGYLVEADGFRLLIDLGAGAFAALQRYVSPADVDAIVISHGHADHCIDLTAYIVALRYGPDGYRARRRMPVIGPPGVRNRIEAAYDPLARKLNLHELFEFSAHADGEIGPFAVSFATTNHPVPTSAVRLTQGGRTLVYSADTGECPALVSLARDADVLLCEATFGPDEPYVPDVHLTGRQAGSHASAAGVGRLIVTHVPPWLSPKTQAGEASGTFSGPIELAHPGAEFNI